MWQRIRDYSSAINFSILNFLRRRNYEQFNDNLDDSVVDRSTDDSGVSDEMQSRPLSASQTESCAIIEHTEVQRTSERNPCANISSGISYGSDVDSDTFTVNQHCTDTDLRQGLRDEVDYDQGHDLVPREVKDVLHSYTQKRYQKFEDENSEDEDFQITSAEETLQLHQSAKDVHRKKSSKTKRRKKKVIYRGFRKLASSVGRAFVIAHGASLLTAEDLAFSTPAG
ncbi:uncharacterized protein LOC111131055 isoform X2 [Crassostrea virginica]